MSNSKTYKAVRVYKNLDKVRYDLRPDEVDNWLDYNKKFRFGCALFLDSVCVYSGYLNDEECSEISVTLHSEMFPVREECPGGI